MVSDTEYNDIIEILNVFLELTDGLFESDIRSITGLSRKKCEHIYDMKAVARALQSELSRRRPGLTM